MKHGDYNELGLFERVSEMERIYVRVKGLVFDPERKDGLENCGKEIEALRDYYENGQWQNDYEADEQGLLPHDMKRGVLSQDALYDLFCEIDRITAKEPPREIDPRDTSRKAAYELWMKAPNPMVTFFKTLDVTNLIRVGKKKHMKFNMLLDFCIGKAAAPIKEFYTLPVGNKLIQYDALAVNTIVKNKNGEINSCDISQSDNLDTFHAEYMKYTAQVSQSCEDRELSSDCMVIGTSAILDTEIDGAVGMNSGIFNNPFLIWGKYRKKLFRYYLPVSFQFHHTQMDGAHAGRFLANLQNEITGLRYTNSGISE